MCIAGLPKPLYPGSEDRPCGPNVGGHTGRTPEGQMAPNPGLRKLTTPGRSHCQSETEQKVSIQLNKTGIAYVPSFLVGFKPTNTYLCKNDPSDRGRTFRCRKDIQIIQHGTKMFCSMAMKFESVLLSDLVFGGNETVFLQEKHLG
jgi:hypothetical protein